MPLHDLQGGVQHSVIEGGGGLADAAADVILGLAPHIDRGRQIALVRRAAAGGVIIREYLAGQQDLSVAGRRRQLYIILAVGAAAHLAGGLPQHILKELALKRALGLFGLGNGQGDGKRCPLSGLLIRLLQGGPVELYPVLLFRDLIGLRIHGRVFYLGVYRVIDGLEVGFLRRILPGHVGHIQHHLSLPLRPSHSLVIGFSHSVCQREQHPLPVNGQAGFPLGHHQLVTLDLIAGLGGIEARFPAHLLQQGVQIGLLLPYRHLVQRQLRAAAQQVPDVLKSLR